jgi:deazaflavin-dependent oxidoreductase (nitroreductase family)
MEDTMTQGRDWNAEVIATFRAKGGEVPAPYDDPPPMLLLHTIGAKSGREHIVPMRGFPDGDDIYVFATAHGSARNPDWYHNLVAHPDIIIERGTESIPVHATVLEGAARQETIDRWIARVPMVRTIFEKTPRDVPVIRLAPRSPSPR